jgi:hypothetical protein
MKCEKCGNEIIGMYCHKCKIDYKKNDTRQEKEAQIESSNISTNERLDSNIFSSFLMVCCYILSLLSIIGGFILYNQYTEQVSVYIFPSYIFIICGFISSIFWSAIGKVLSNQKRIIQYIIDN